MIVICLALVFVGSVVGWAAHGLTALIIARVLMGAAFPRSAARRR